VFTVKKSSNMHDRLLTCRRQATAISNIANIPGPSTLRREVVQK